MKVLGMALMPFVALAAKALPDGQQYFGRIRDNTPIVTNGYTRMQIDARACHVLESANTYTDAATNAAHKSAVGMVSAARGYADGATNRMAAALRGEIGDAANRVPATVSNVVDAAFVSGRARQISNTRAGVYSRIGFDANNVPYVEVPPKKASLLKPDGSPFATSNMVAGALAPYAKTVDLPTVPTKVSAFQNDAGYVTKAVTNGLASAASVASQASSLSSLSSTVEAHEADTSNPHGVTAAQVGALTRDEADAEYYPADEGALWSSWWSGDGFRVVVSNYDVSAAAEGTVWERLPAAAFEYRPGGTGELVRVWDERTRWERARASFGEFTNALELVLADKAGLDWGKTTPTGFDAPEGFTWLDTPAVAVAGGLAWQKTVTSEGAVWLLCSNGMVAELGSSAASANGYFKITDERGETAFEIVQGDRRTVGANPASVFTWKAADGKTHLRVVYNVVSDTAPTLHVATSLQAGSATVWKDEGADDCPASFAGWTGASGAWTNALWRTAAPAAGETDALFCYATYILKPKGLDVYENPYTVEFVFEKETGDGFENIRWNTSAYPFILRNNGSDGYSPNAYLSGLGSPTSYPKYTLAIGELHSIVAQANGEGTRRIWFDGDFLGSFVQDVGSRVVREGSASPMKIVLTKRTGYPHSYRLYSRVLTPSEIAHNYRVDCKRFGLGAASANAALLDADTAAPFASAALDAITGARPALGEAVQTESPNERK